MIKRIWNKQKVICTCNIGERVAIYNGKSFFKMFIRKEMLGYRFGDFIYTKRIGFVIHSKKKKKK